MFAEIFPPGDFLKEEMEARNWTQNDLSKILGKSNRLVNELINAKRAITPETAKVLADAFGTSAIYWMNLESAWQLFKLNENGNDVSRRAQLFERFAVNDVIRRGWVEDSDSLEVLEKRFFEFYEVKSINEAPNCAALFRRSDSTDQVSPLQLAWLYRARQIAKNTKVSRFSELKLQNALGQLRDLRAYEEQTREIPRLLSEAGIRFIVIEPFKGSKVDGVCFWLNKSSPAIAISLRFDRIDNFWFTLKHELRHLANRDSLDNTPVIDIDLLSDNGNDDDPVEKRANEEASEFLVPQAELKHFIARTSPLYSTERVRGFAHRIGVHPGIVVGRLQHLGEIPWANLKTFQVKIRHLITPNAITDGFGHTLVF